LATHPLKDFIVRFRKGDRVYSEGDAGSEMFIVQSGAVQIFRTLGGKRQTLAVMEKGDFFGEMSVLEGSARAASAEAAEDSELIEINSTVFDRMIRGNIEIAVRMLRKLCSRLRESNRRFEEQVASMDPAVPAAHDLDRRLDPPPPVEPPPPSSSPAPPPLETDSGVVRLAPDWLGALILGEGEQVFPIRGASSLIGRFDPVTGTRPEIDLTQYDTNRSVSRRHAKVLAREGELYVTEEVGALNGTFLNGQRLTTGKPQLIRSGDTLALGMVMLRFQGKEAEPGRT
jgi:Cyclic nucleotide-binding domain/FHA domain